MTAATCSWCGHKPHPNKCPRRITTGPKNHDPLPLQETRPAMTDRTNTESEDDQ